LVILSTATLADAPPRPEPTLFDSPPPPPIVEMFLPLVMGGTGPPPTEVCNPSAELGETCWTFQYPNSGNVLCGCDGEDCPVPTHGECIFRFGGWHDITETGQTADFYMSEGLTYHLSFDREIWSTEWPFQYEYDTLDVYLVTPGGHHHHLFEFTNLDHGTEWGISAISIGPAVTGMYSLLFVAITDEEKDPAFPGLTNFFIDNIILREWGDCKECVICQVLDEPPVEFCEQGHADDCIGCCPDGNDCDGLDPHCPILPPPHFYREVGRYTECYETLSFQIPIPDDWPTDAHPAPPLRELH
jgi:hypothetical protein